MRDFFMPVVEENEPMTFQIGFSAPEGVLLASDCKNQNLVGYRWGMIAPKIKVHENENLAYCSAGDDFCNAFTETIREEIRKNALRFVEAKSKTPSRNASIQRERNTLHFAGSTRF